MKTLDPMKTLALVLTLGLLAIGCSQEQATAEVGLVTPEQLLSEPPANALVLDVRTPEEYSGGHVPGAINVPHTEVAERLEELGGDRDRTVVVYCERGGRASQAEAALLAGGFTDVRHLEGDMSDWRAKGRPLERL